MMQKDVFGNKTNTVYLLCPCHWLMAQGGQDKRWGLLCYGHSGPQGNKTIQRSLKSTNQIAISLSHHQAGRNSNWQDNNESQEIVFPSPAAMLLGVNAQYKDAIWRSSPIFLY